MESFFFLCICCCHTKWEKNGKAKKKKIKSMYETMSIEHHADFNVYCNRMNVKYAIYAGEKWHFANDINDHHSFHCNMLIWIYHLPSNKNIYMNIWNYITYTNNVRMNKQKYHRKFSVFDFFFFRRSYRQPIKNIRLCWIIVFTW